MQDENVFQYGLISSPTDLPTRLVRVAEFISQQQATLAQAPESIQPYVVGRETPRRYQARLHRCIKYGVHLWMSCTHQASVVYPLVMIVLAAPLINTLTMSSESSCLIDAETFISNANRKMHLLYLIFFGHNHE